MKDILDLFEIKDFSCPALVQLAFGTLFKQNMREEKPGKTKSIVK